MLKLNIQRFADGTVVIDLDINTKSFEAQINKLENELDTLEKYATSKNLAPEEGSQEWIDLQNEIEKTKNKLNDLYKKQQDIDNQGMNNFKSNIDKVGNSITNVISKVKRWALAVFGIRSAYSAVRSAMSILSQYDDGMATKIEYIRYLLASALKPIIETLVDLAYKLLAYINYISQAWFGVNLFANASVKAFKKVNSGIQKTNKSAKELQKTLTGFDEMNILQKDGSVSTGGGGGGLGTDFSQIEDINKVKIPEWVEWIAKNKDTIITAIKEIAGILVTSFIIDKFLTWANAIGKLKDGLVKLIPKLENMSGLQIFGMIAGIATALTGIFKVVEALPKFLSDPSWSSFEDVLEGISLIIAGIGITLVAMKLTSIVGWVMAIVGALVFLFTSLHDNRTETEKLKDAQDKLNESQNKYVEASKTQLNAYNNLKQEKKDFKKVSKDLGLTEEEAQKKASKLYDLYRSGKGDVTELKGENLKLYEAYLDLLDAQGRVKKANDEVHQARLDEMADGLEVQGMLADTSDKYLQLGEDIVKAYNEGAISSLEAAEKMKTALAGMEEANKKTFKEKIPKDIKGTMTLLDTLASPTEPWLIQIDVNKKKAESKIKSLADMLGNAFTSLNSAFTTKTKKKAKGGIVGYAKGGIIGIPKLASGAVINQPGRGVPLAIGGEVGREGVIPLTDSQQMALLGEAIGKYITINANITNTMNGRVISRSLQQIKNDDDFAYNR